MNSERISDQGVLDSGTPSESSQRLSPESIALRSLPFLSDHGLQDMPVLPGSAYIELAISNRKIRSKNQFWSIRDITFQRPVILSDRSSLNIRRMADDDGGFTCSFYEGTEESQVSDEKPSARLTLNSETRSDPGETADSNLKTILSDRSLSTEGAAFYAQMRTNGNQYGPHFQSITRISIRENEAISEVRLPTAFAQSTLNHGRIILMDAAVQTVAAITVRKGRTFLIKSIDRVKLQAGSIPDKLWVHATRRVDPSEPEDRFFGNVAAYDETNSLVFAFEGVSLAFLDSVATEPERRPLSIAVSATFTAEPIGESLRFWSEYFDLPTSVEFAPYNQVFQQLLDPTGLTRRNASGANVLLLKLDDWLAEARTKPLLGDPNVRERCFAGLQRYILPNGMEIAHLNSQETTYLFGEIFEGETYLRHGIQLNAGDTVLDIGANIGMFSLFVASRVPDAKVLAFEPNPVVFPILKANCNAYSPRLQALNFGISERRGTANFSFYEHASVFSSFHPDHEEDRHAIEAVVRNMVRREAGDDESLIETTVKELTVDRLKQKTFECRLLSVSDVIREHGLERIHLLKVDAERCELEILRGISEEHWPIIDQIVIEVHDTAGTTLEFIRELLGQKGYTCAVEEETLLKGSGLFNLYARRELDKTSTAKDDSPLAKLLNERVSEFLGALETCRQASSSPLILGLCPTGSEGKRPGEISAALSLAEEEVIKRARQLPDVSVIRSDEFLNGCASSAFFDADAMELGHVPYSVEGCAAIGSQIFRKIAMLRRQPYKVVVVDCDNTLWDGACGEEGWNGVRIDETHRAFQQFIVDNVNAGMLVCLCSKNVEQDVFDVFDNRSEMLLKREHLAAWRINWQPKSENIRVLATELQLGLDSFIFIDDNSMECAEVRTRCPEVLTLQLPGDRTHLAQWLKNLWPFDHREATQADRERTRQYQANKARETFRRQTGSLKSFIEGLQLQVVTTELKEEQYARASQLTYRTNQFNFTTIRRSEAELRQLLKSGFRGFSVHVQDRFGDYGFVGLVLYELCPDRYRVDTFLLSCRVLGKGVQHRVLSELGRLARLESIPSVELSYIPSSRNEPAKAFLDNLQSTLNPTHLGDGRFLFDATRLETLQYDPDDIPSLENRTEDSSRDISNISNGAASLANPTWNQRYQAIADTLYEAAAIVQAMSGSRRIENEVSGGSATDTTLEGVLLRIWRSVLQKPELGVNENFFDAGGTSLKAVRVVALIRKQLMRDIPLVTLFECPTVKRLAERLEGPVDASDSKKEALNRGLQRRQKSVRRRDRQPLL